MNLNEVNEQAIAAERRRFEEAVRMCQVYFNEPSDSQPSRPLLDRRDVLCAIWPKEKGQSEPFSRCVACQELTLGGRFMPCCGIGPVCDTCHDKHSHEFILMTTTGHTSAHQVPKIEAAAYARGHDEGRRGQAMLELAGRDRFIRELVCRHCGRRQGQTIEDTDA